MKTVKLSTLFATITFIAYVVIFGFQQIQPSFAKAQADNESPKLTLELSTPQNSYIQLEPIPLDFKLLNQTNQALTWRGTFMLGEDIDLLVKGDNGQEKRFDGRKFFLGSVISLPRTTQPGAEIKANNLLGDVNLIEFVFPKSGTYQVRVEFRYDKISGQEQQQEKILSNPITLHIKEPQGIDWVAYNYIKNTLEPARERQRVSPEELAQLQQTFINNYSSSVYAKYIVVKLASAYRGLGEDEKALRELCKVSDEKFYYSKEVERELHRIHIKLHPTVLLPLPENATVPPRPHPCRAVQN